jgi:ketosteroid isomerase-like protein
MSSTTTEDQVQPLEASAARNQAMINQDTALLSRLLAHDYTARHITGYEQTKQEWLQQISTGQMRYHSVHELDNAVQVDGDTAVVTSRALVDATIYRARGRWSLRSTTTYQRRAGQWQVVRSMAESTAPEPSS